MGNKNLAVRNVVEKFLEAQKAKYAALAAEAELGKAVGLAFDNGVKEGPYCIDGYVVLFDIEAPLSKSVEINKQKLPDEEV